MKRPSFQFYPADWRKDSALQSCSLAAQGLWINLMCTAHECVPYGHLVINGAPLTAAQLARLIGGSEKKMAGLLAELEAAGVFSRDELGAIYSRRMSKDEHIRTVRAAAGHAGWESKGGTRSSGRFAQAKGNGSGGFAQAKAEQSTAPSSSSSTSVSPIAPPHKGNGEVHRRRQRVPATPCPARFELTDEMVQWAEKQGVSLDQVRPQTERFIDHWKSKGELRADWDATWRNWMRKAVEFNRRAG